VGNNGDVANSLVQAFLCNLFTGETGVGRKPGTVRPVQSHG
jgi:hypothetical protein